MSISFLCPTCKGKRREEVIKSDGFNNTVTGFFISNCCSKWYPIINGVPVFLTYRTRLHKDFKSRFSGELRRVNAQMVNGKPPSGEESIVETFTEEWEGLGDDEVVFAYDFEQGLALHQKVWLKDYPEGAMQTSNILNVGAGGGRESEYLATIFPNSVVYAIDINRQLISNGTNIKKRGNIIPIIASLFALPFKERQFDHVHCQGVLHHTYNTEIAFKSIETMVKLDFGSLFVWIYGWEDSFGKTGLEGIFRHLYYITSHRLFRPILSRSPRYVRTPAVLFISYVYHFLLKISKKVSDSWKLKNTIHAVRDMFTPRYAHRHMHHELVEWYENAGYNALYPQSAKIYRELFNRQILGIGFLGVRKK